MDGFNYVDKPAPYVIMLHWLGGSARTWTEVSKGIARLGVRPAALDLPGFGLAREDIEFSIEHAVEQVISVVQRLRSGQDQVPWLIATRDAGMAPRRVWM